MVFPDYFRGQLRLSCPGNPHTLHFPALGETSQDRLSWPPIPHTEQVLVPAELTAVLPVLLVFNTSMGNPRPSPQLAQIHGSGLDSSQTHLVVRR